MINKRTKRKCICCGTWKDVFVKNYTCLCNSCHLIIWKRINAYDKEYGKYPNFQTLYKQLKLEKSTNIKGDRK